MLPTRLRSLLFAPAVRPDLLAKMPATGADAVVIDLEDATPPDAKDIGRSQLAQFVPELAARVPVLVRINEPSSPWYRDDIAALPSGLTAVVIPKVERPSDLTSAAADLDSVGCDAPILAGIETAQGVADSRTLLAHPRIVAAYFGAEDYIADMGGVRTSSNVEVLMARSTVALSARLANVVAIDQVVADFHDDTRFRTECLEARAMGFAGKLCIHPAQVALANEGFVPSPAEIERAQQLLAAYADAQARGLASIAFDGQMVDEPVAEQARQLLAQVPEPGPDGGA